MAVEANSSPSIDIEEIVREVLRRLPERPSGKTPDKESLKRANEIVIDQRVVTLASLDGRLKGATQVVVPRGAVITPAVRDVLRQSGVALTFATADRATNKQNNHRLSFAIVDTSYEPSGLLRAIGDQYASIEQLATTGLATVVEELASQVARGGNLGLLLTGKTAVAACLANRQRGVRAFVASDVSDVTAAIAELGANLVVVNPAGRGTFELVQIARRFAAPGGRKCPAELSAKLG